MDVFRALILGVVQGLTEFLPVSSSGHLVLVRALFGWRDEGLAFDAALHLGTLAAVLWFFRVLWWSMLRGRAPSLLRAVVIATVPAALVGLVGERWIATSFRTPWSIGVAFLVTAVLLWLAERVGKRHGRLAWSLRTGDALVIGLAQVAALLPGLSRSGVTMAAGMFRGLSRADAVEFSFLLAMPITAAAGLEGLRQLVTLTPAQVLPVSAGLAAAFVAGSAAIGFLLRTIQTRTFRPYILYLFAVGLGLLVFA